MNRKATALGIHGVLSDPRVLRTHVDETEWYAAVGVVEVLTETEHPEEYWNDLKEREPALAEMAEEVEFICGEGGQTRTFNALDLNGVLRLVQSVSSPRAERIKRWLSDSARQWMQESENPELALLRARKLYEHRGYSRRWIDKRLRGVSARHELTAEWYRRGAHESDEYRALTNQMLKSAFGLDVQEYRRFKGLGSTNESLRDHMSDLELALMTLAETTAVALHRDHNSEGAEQLLNDVTAAGQIVSQTAGQIQQRVQRHIIDAGNHLERPTERVQPPPPPSLSACA